MEEYVKGQFELSAAILLEGQFFVLLFDDEPCGVQIQFDDGLSLLQHGSRLLQDAHQPRIDRAKDDLPRTEVPPCPKQ